MSGGKRFKTRQAMKEIIMMSTISHVQQSYQADKDSVPTVLIEKINRLIDEKGMIPTEKGQYYFVIPSIIN